MKHESLVALACGVFATLARGEPLASATPANTAREWHFNVFLGSRVIGRHDFFVSGTDDNADVVNHATFKVSAFHLLFYHYEHRDHERWRAGCLNRVDTQTNDNGREYFVHGRAVGDTFEVRNSLGSTTLHGCIRSFAYWNPGMLEHPPLLNTQTGKYESVQVVREQDTRSVVPGATDRYILAGHDYRIELWYSAAAQWLALAVHTADGHFLRYEAQP